MPSIAATVALALGAVILLVVIFVYMKDHEFNVGDGAFCASGVVLVTATMWRSIEVGAEGLKMQALVEEAVQSATEARSAARAVKEELDLTQRVALAEADSTRERQQIEERQAVVAMLREGRVDEAADMAPRNPVVLAEKIKTEAAAGNHQAVVDAWTDLQGASGEKLVALDAYPRAAVAYDKLGQSGDAMQVVRDLKRQVDEIKNSRAATYKDTLESLRAALEEAKKGASPEIVQALEEVAAELPPAEKKPGVSRPSLKEISPGKLQPVPRGQPGG